MHRVFALLLLLIPAVGHTQALPVTRLSRPALYASGGAEHSQFNGQVWTKAATLGAFANLRSLGPLALAVDIRVNLATDTETYLVGPRLALHLPLIPVKPYAEVLVGDLAYTTLQSQAASNFVTRYAAGIDTTILPHIDWRVAELTYGHLPQEPNQNSRALALTTGLVFRF